MIPEEYKSTHKREELQPVFAAIKSNPITLLRGIRGTGKTLFIYHLIDLLLKEKNNPKNILFLDLSLTGITNNSELKSYIGEFLEKSVPNSDNNFYFFINDCLLIKNTIDIFDNFNKSYSSMRFILAIQQKNIMSSEIVNNRITRFNLLPLSFSAFLSKSRIHSSKINFKMNNLLDFDLFRSKEKSFKANENKIKPVLESFLSLTSLPEYSNISNNYNRNKLIHENVICRIIYKDFSKLYEIRNPELVEKLLYYLSKNSASITNLLQISKKFKISYPSLLRYLKYLEESLLVFSIRNYYFGSGKKKRTNRKTIAADFAFIRNPENKNMFIKTAIFNHVYNIMDTDEKNIYYWHHDRSSMDLLIDCDGLLIPVQIAYSDSIAKKEIRGIERFLLKQKYERGIIITESAFSFIKSEKYEIMLLPAWIFLLMEK